MGAWGELLHWGPWKIRRKGSGDGNLSLYGPRFGEPGGGLTYLGL
jgi:hypothetical protein